MKYDKCPSKIETRDFSMHVKGGFDAESQSEIYRSGIPDRERGSK
jgi:hypothetical protein